MKFSDLKHVIAASFIASAPFFSAYALVAKQIVLQQREAIHAVAPA